MEAQICYVKKKIILHKFFFLVCDRCNENFHFKCIGYTGGMENAEKMEFICFDCERKEDKQIVIERHKKNSIFFNSDSYYMKFIEEIEKNN